MVIAPDEVVFSNENSCFSLKVGDISEAGCFFEVRKF
jgi:hypothetical protein